MIKMRICGIIILSLIVAGCGLSKEEIGEAVKLSMQEKLDSESQWQQWHLNILNVQVFRKGWNKYQGIAKVKHEGTSHDVQVEITADGKNVMWKVPPGGFSFIVQKELEKLQSIFTIELNGVKRY